MKMTHNKLGKIPDFVSYPALDQSIRHSHKTQALVAISEKAQKKAKNEGMKKPTLKSGVYKVQQLREEEKMRMMKILVKKTGHKEEDLQRQFKNFMKICPDGVLTKRKFIDLSQEMYGPQAKNLSEAIFSIFDEEKTSKIDFVKYVLAINASKMNSPEEKLIWIFNVFDRDSSESIDGEEIEDVLRGLFAMAEIDTDEDGVKRSKKEIVGACDDDGDGRITRDEFVKNALDSKFIQSIL